MKLSPKLESIILGMTSGLLMSLGSSIIYNYSFLIFIALLPLLITWNRNSNWQHILLSSMSYGLIYNFMCFFWIPLSLSEMWKFPLIVSFGSFLPIALFSEFQFFITAIFRKKIFQKYSSNFLTISIISLIYIATEKLCSTVFPDSIGTSFYSIPLINQSFDISGVSLLSGLLWFSTETILLTWKSKKIKNIIPLIVIYALLGFYGQHRLNQFNEASLNSSKLNALIIQPNFHHSIRNSARQGNENNVDAVLGRQYQMTLTGLSEHPNTDFIIWPETTYPFYFNSYSNLYEEKIENELKNFLYDKPVTLFFGSFGKTGEPIRITNNLYSISHNQNIPLINHWEKTVLFPFGEYIPGLKMFPWLKSVFPKANTPEAAPEPSVIEIPFKDKNIKVGAAICYEVLFSETLMVSSHKNVDLMVNISNESYFGHFGEPQLNIMNAAIRSIEMRVPWVRSANTGISGAIDASGQILYQSKMDVEAIYFQEIPLTTKIFKPGLYAIFGDWLGFLSYITLSLVTFFLIFRKYRN